MHGLVSWDKHCADRAISAATLLGCNLNYNARRSWRVQARRNIHAKQDFTSGLGPWPGFRYAGEEARRKRTPSGHKCPEKAGELLLLSQTLCLICHLSPAFHMPVEVRTHGGHVCVLKLWASVVWLSFRYTIYQVGSIPFQCLLNMSE